MKKTRTKNYVRPSSPIATSLNFKGMQCDVALAGTYDIVKLLFSFRQVRVLFCTPGVRTAEGGRCMRMMYHNAEPTGHLNVSTKKKEPV